MVQNWVIATLTVKQIFPDWLIDWIEFYAVTAIFHPCNGDNFPLYAYHNARHEMARIVINCFRWKTHSHIDILEDIFPKNMKSQPIHKHWIDFFKVLKTPKLKPWGYLDCWWSFLRCGLRNTHDRRDKLECNAKWCLISQYLTTTLLKAVQQDDRSLV